MRTSTVYKADQSNAHVLSFECGLDAMGINMDWHDRPNAALTSLLHLRRIFILLHFYFYIIILHYILYILYYYILFYVLLYFILFLYYYSLF